MITSMVVLITLCCASAFALQEGQTIDVNGLFSFRLPAGFTKHTGDDERAEYRKGETKLIYIWGHTESAAYSDRRQTSMHDYQESTTRISGKRANIRTYRQTVKGRRIYRAELNVGNWEKGEVQLYMKVESSDSAILDTAREIFKSVSFPIPSPERPDPLHRESGAH
jgi:hypothetical protein